MEGGREPNNYAAKCDAECVLVAVRTRAQTIVVSGETTRWAPSSTAWVEFEKTG